MIDEPEEIADAMATDVPPAPEPPEDEDDRAADEAQDVDDE